MKIRQIDRAMQDGSQDKSEKYACVHWTLSGHGFLGVEFGISFHFFCIIGALNEIVDELRSNSNTLQSNALPSVRNFEYINVYKMQ